MNLYRLKYLLSRKYISYYEEEKWLETLKKRKDIPLSWFISFRRIKLNCESREAPEKRGIILRAFEEPRHGKALSVEQVNLLVRYSSLPSDYLRSLRNQMRLGRTLEELEVTTKYK